MYKKYIAYYCVYDTADVYILIMKMILNSLFFLSSSYLSTFFVKEKK